ncbi:MAG: hypothetical protein AAFR67_00090 [Chloroflexota bacterium]
MSKWIQSELNYFIKILRANDPNDIAMWLLHYSDMGEGSEPHPIPTCNDQVIYYLEKLLEDRRPCAITDRAPYDYGELRWLAARALACEYAYRGIDTPIILEEVAMPVSQRELGGLDNFSNRIQSGQVQTKTEIIDPQDWCKWCCKEAVEEQQCNEEE